MSEIRQQESSLPRFANGTATAINVAAYALKSPTNAPRISKRAELCAMRPQGILRALHPISDGGCR